MKYPIKSILLILSMLAFSPTIQARTLSPTFALRIDSVGIEKKNGKRYIIHRVDEGQTLYAISRRYRQSVADIRAANPDLKEALQYHQLVLVPIADGSLTRKQEKAIDKAIRKQEKEDKRESIVNEKSDDPAKAGIHVVESGQTLYSLATRYGVSQDDLRKWNNLSGNNVLLGQALIVSEKAYQARTPSNVSIKPIPPKTNTAPEPHVAEQRPAAEPKPERPVDNDATYRPRTEPDVASRPAPTAPAAKPAEAEAEIPRPGNDAPMPTLGRRISDSGVAEMIDGDDSGKYLALHRTAPIGTLIQVRNEFNNQSLWVKVIGRLPNTGINDKILIKLSSQAFAKLSPQDRRFRAEVSYIVK